jgi:hypothetical protein
VQKLAGVRQLACRVKGCLGGSEICLGLRDEKHAVAVAGLGETRMARIELF